LAHRGEKLKEPVLLFGEAYSKCRDSEVRRHIAAAVRRAFTGSGVRGKDDAEFVRNAMQWYEKERGHLMLNSCYWYRPSVVGPHEEDDPNFRWLTDYEKMPPLFVERGRENGDKGQVK
jgi:hypothetical protein